MRKHVFLVLLLSCILFTLPQKSDGQVIHGPEGSELAVSYGTPSGVGFIVDIFKFSIEGIVYGMQENRNVEPKLFGVLGLDYYYQVNNWFRPGMKVVYEGVRSSVYDDNHVLVSRYYSSILDFMPSVQFSYLNRRLVKLYSGIDLGLALSFSNNMDDAVPTSLSYAFAFNVTPIGIRVGNEHVFGLVETNIGFDAMIKAGIGVRF